MYFFIGAAGLGAIVFSCVALPVAIWTYRRYKDRLVRWLPVPQPDSSAVEEYPMNELSDHTLTNGEEVDEDLTPAEGADDDELEHVI